MTVVAQGRELLFGEIEEDRMEPNAAGKVVLAVWAALPEHFPHVRTDTFVLMPNHVHFVVEIMDAESSSGAETVGAETKGAETAPLRESRVGVVGAGSPCPRGEAGLGQIVAYFKYQSTKRINAQRGTPGLRRWQRNYYERVIRDERELGRAREYIESNPLRWAVDHENPSYKGSGGHIGRR